MSPLDSKEIIGRTDAEALIFWPPDAKSRVTEDEMVGWHHQHNGHESEQTAGDSEGHWCAAVHGISKSQTRLSD